VPLTERGLVLEEAVRAALGPGLEALRLETGVAPRVLVTEDAGELVVVIRVAVAPPEGRRGPGSGGRGA
jgi:hypothetical protein